MISRRALEISTAALTGIFGVVVVVSSVDNGIGSPRTHSDIRIEHGSTAGTTVDYDLVHLSTADTLLIWDSVSYKSLSAFQAASGQER